VKSLWSRPYLDKNRVGIYGTSYGGYASAMALLRYSGCLFRPPPRLRRSQDWRHYDTIYTERYMWKPQDNASGYDAGSVMTHAADLKGRLMLYYGTAGQQCASLEHDAICSGAAAGRERVSICRLVRTRVTLV